ncbi:MAG: DUF6365 family protein [Arachnia sp.]
MSEIVRFIAPSAWSIGELANAIEFSRRLPSGWTSEFLVSTKHLAYARAAGLNATVLPRGRSAGAVVREVAAAVDTSALVLADHHLLGLERVGFDFRDLSGARNLIAVDSLSFGPGPTQLRIAVSDREGAAPLQRWFPPTVAVPAVPEGVPLLRPVPVSGLSSSAGAHTVLPFDLFADEHGQSLPRMGRTAAETRARLGIEHNRKLVVIALSNWASKAWTKPSLGKVNPDRNTHLILRLNWLRELVSRIGQPLALVGVTGEVVDADLGAQVITTGMLPIDDFTDLLAAADLFLTDNITSGAMARAALVGTPVLTLTREHDAWEEDAFVGKWRRDMEEHFPGFDFPFLVNPFGWMSELAPLLAENPYLAAVPRADAYSLAAQVAACSAALDSPDRPVTDALQLQRHGLPSGAAALSVALDGAISGPSNDPTPTP